MVGARKHVWGTEQVHIEISWENMKERNRLEDLGIDDRIVFEWIVKKSFVSMWLGLAWLKLETGGRM
jgi:hypothetical protein